MCVLKNLVFIATLILIIDYVKLHQVDNESSLYEASRHFLN